MSRSHATVCSYFITLKEVMNREMLYSFRHDPVVCRKAGSDLKG